MALLLKFPTILLVAFSLLSACSRPAAAQTALTVAAPPAAMMISTAVAGSQPTASSVASTYTVQVKPVAGVKKITAQLDLAMPTNTTLTMTLAAPPGATSQGPVVMSTTATDMVVNLASINPSQTRAITYSFSATVAAGVLTSQSRTITFTLVNYP
jgi:hypothetical protein